jgi:hypothetical protein
METECVAECCGIDAFDLSPERIRNAARETTVPMLGPKLIAFQNRVQNSCDEVFISKRLNNLFHRNVLAKLLEHVIAHVTLGPTQSADIRVS